MTTSTLLLGDGVRLVDHPGGRTVRLEPVDRPEVTGPTGRWFRVVRQGAPAGTSPG